VSGWILARIYTRTGDKGETGLTGGARVSKDARRVRAYGDIDELNSVLGLARAGSKDEEIASTLEMVQRDLFTVGADLASPKQEGHDVPRIGKDMVMRLERTIDTFQERLPILKVFILPGGGETAALLHFARSVARRAERNIVALSETEPISEDMVPYVNRLSDLLFVMARFSNQLEGRKETEWHQTK
jgi:cob(I)alamin adenosyltransferase